MAIGAAVVISGCTSTPAPTVASSKRSKEYFAESEYGVKASPRVSSLRSNLPRGGGREQVGRPYKIKGKWYYPKEVAGYRNSGMASWYGDAFHGRLTANGEIYDMTHLTAAHPTMPLPSYARVTNRQSGASVIVRVNDRGPYAHGRIIDLSRRAAELLDYTHSGVAKVDVEYVGRAPLHGQDDEYLVASFKPGNQAPDPSDGLPTGVMIAMNGATPTSASTGAAPFPGTLKAAPFPTAPAMQAGDPILPDLGPIAPERPWVELAGRQRPAVAALGYASIGRNNGVMAVESFASAGAAAGIGATQASQVAPYVAVGTFAGEADARALAKLLALQARVDIDDSGDGFAVTARPRDGGSIDDVLRSAWAAGASDAMTIRD